MKLSSKLAMFFVATGSILAGNASAVVTWDFDQFNSTVALRGLTFADHGANGFAPGGIFDTDGDLNIAYGPNGPGSVTATINPISRDSIPAIPAVTSASSAAFTTLTGIGSPTATFSFRAATLHDNFGADGHLAEGDADGVSNVFLNFDGLVGATSVTIDYTWIYSAIADPDNEGAAEDPEMAEGSLSVFSSSGMGPNNLYAVTNLGPVGISGNGFGSWTEVVSPGDFVGLALDMRAYARMESPGVGAFQEDLAGSEFFGEITLTITVPEPTALSLLALTNLGALRRARRSA